MEISKRYKIIERIGESTKRKFGDIHIALDTELGAKVIIKSIQKKSNTQVAIERLRNEATFTFNFPGLPSKAQIVESENEVYLIREFIEGQTLDIFWKGLKKRNRADFLIQFLSKLLPIFQHLESEGIVHSDIKPSNIIVSNNSNFQVELIDFGLAIRMNESETRKMLFPLGYAAPELLLNHLDMVNQKTDQYALGVTIWRLHCGELPLRHPNPSVFTNLQLTHPLPDNPNLPKGLHGILYKMCNKHQFAIPPSQMESVEVKEKLRTAINARYDSISDAIEEIKTLPKKRSLLPNNIFSIS